MTQFVGHLVVGVRSWAPPKQAKTQWASTSMPLTARSLFDSIGTKKRAIGGMIPNFGADNIKKSTQFGGAPRASPAVID